MVLVLQAEDGIRDGHVTGVQTCALPISIFYVNASSGNNMMIRYNQYQHVYLGHGDSDKPPSYNPTHAMYDHIFAAEIGRASCRERRHVPGHRDGRKGALSGPDRECRTMQ